MAMGVTVDMIKFRLFSRLLENFATKSIPFAARNSLNEIAFGARQEWATKQLPEAFTLRNTWTAKGLRVEKAQGRTIEGMHSKVGSLREYMMGREEGATQTKRGKHGVAIPMSGAAGQGAKQKRTRLVRRPNYLSALQVVKRKGSSKRQQNAISISMAKKTGGVAFLEVGRRKGLFAVGGGKQKKPRLKLLYDLSHSTVTTKPIPTLERTIDAMRPRFLAIHMKHMRAELVRHRMAW
jgi:hypothetical protein